MANRKVEANKVLPVGCREKAFNEGSDARIAGIPLAANPYLTGSGYYSYWRMGWKDVESNWGQDAFWPVKPLPLVARV
jgi:hypothetical protein